MKEYKYKVRTVSLLIGLCVTAVALLLVFCSVYTASAESNDQNNNDIMLLSTKTDYTLMSNISVGSITDLKYIDNADYFRVNPKHAKQNSDYNSQGTCTTVAMQMLFGYHNYYSDRNIVPQFSTDGVRFLDDDYGKEDENPLIMVHDPTEDPYGRPSIGTEDAVYDELFNLTVAGDFPGLGQSIFNIADADSKRL